MPDVFARNIHQMLPEARDFLFKSGHWNKRRNGTIFEYNGPVTLSYSRPTERVLFYQNRDANPFFHLFESLWMLAGREDVAWLSQWSSRISQYSDNGETFNGAYGFRWRTHHGPDQIRTVIRLLNDEIESRRAVIQMWSPTRDLNISDSRTKDACCNLSCVFCVGADERLDLTVFNRSNDLILGCCGANAVHFSILLEYVASAIRVPVGRYFQVSNNLHAYEEAWKGFVHYDLSQKDPYESKEVKSYPLIGIHEEWNWELNKFMMAAEPNSNFIFPEFHEKFFRETAVPMALAHRLWRDKEDPERFVQAKVALEAMPSDSDWRKASWEWIDRREKRASP